MEHSEHTSAGRTAKGVRTPLDSLDEDVPKRRQKAAKETFRRIELASDAPKPNLSERCRSETSGKSAADLL
jgi:hypothetical protein